MGDLNKPILFVATMDADRARNFYESVLGLKFVSDDPAAIVFDVGGTMLRIQKVQDLPVVPHTVLGWEVDDIYKTIAALRARGVHFTEFVHIHQDDDGVWVSPSGAKVAWFSDPDGNTLSLTQQ